MKKSYIIAIIVIIILALVIWWYVGNNQKLSTNNQQQTQTEADTVDSINQDLNSVDLGNLNADFQEIDKDINSL